MPTFSNFLYTQLVLKIPKPTTSFTSKTVIITGGSSGLGKEAARHIVRLGAGKVILGCRNVTKGKKAKLELELSLRCSPEIIEIWEIDVESPPSVKRFVDRVNTLPRLDVLINNAGIQTIKFDTVYGTEKVIGINVIGTFLVALQLIPKLKETSKVHGVTPHMTFLGSALYDVAKYPENHGDEIFAWLGEKNHVNMMDENIYNLSKLLLLYAIVKLASIVDPLTSDKLGDLNTIVINSLDPCFCKTGLADELKGAIKIFFKVFEAIFARTAVEGSSLVVVAASAGRQTHGLYMRGGAVEEYMTFITNEKGKRRTEHVWDQLCKKLETLQPGILANLQAA